MVGTIPIYIVYDNVTQCFGHEPLPGAMRFSQKPNNWDRAGIQQQLRAYGGRHNGETDRENRASLDRLERTTKDVCFLVSILQVREQVVSFYVSFPESALNASIALIVSIPRHASMDGLAFLSSSGRDH